MRVCISFETLSALRKKQILASRYSKRMHTERNDHRDREKREYYTHISAGRKVVSANWSYITTLLCAFNIAKNTQFSSFFFYITACRMRERQVWRVPHVISYLRRARSPTIYIPSQIQDRISAHRSLYEKKSGGEGKIYSNYTYPYDIPEFHLEKLIDDDRARIYEAFHVNSPSVAQNSAVLGSCSN